MSIVWTSCGLFQDFERRMASLDARPKVNPIILSEEVDQRLMALHHYYLLGLLALGQIEQGSGALFSRGVYLDLLAIQIQVDEIEAEIKRMDAISGQHEEIMRKIRDFSSQSFMHTLATENLIYKLGEFSAETIDPSEKELLGIYQGLKGRKDLFTIEKNIEHLAHLMDGQLPHGKSPFRPSMGREGNITGDEFPAKVWALTFEDGPDVSITPEILSELKKRNLKATFFHLGSKGQDTAEMTKELKKADMEIASHSWSHQDLTRVSERELEEEIQQGEGAKLFRLPYGSGMGSQLIREKLLDKNLLHVLWNVDALDWLPQSPLRIALRTKRLMEQTKRDAGIIMIHETHPRSVTSASLIMDFLRQNGRRTCKIGEIVLQINQGQKTICSKEI